MGVLKGTGCFLGVILLLLVIAYLPTPQHTHYWDVIFDTGHILIFGMVTLLLILIVEVLWPTARRQDHYVVAACLAFSLGLGVEFAQLFTERAAEGIDILNDLAGVVAACCLYATWDRRAMLSTGQRLALLLVAVIWLAAGFAPLVQTQRQYDTRLSLLPALMDWQTLWFEKLYYFTRSNYCAVPRPRDWPATDGRPRYIARIEARPGAYPGFVFTDPYPDWSGYAAFEMEVRLDDYTPRDFVLRVHDTHHDTQDWRDRFRTVIRVRPGLQTIRVEVDDIRDGPQNRQLDVRQIDGLAFFTPDLERPIVFCLGDIRLVK